MSSAGSDRHWDALARVVRERRLELGITSQRAAASKANIHVNTWNALENGKPVSMESLDAMHRVLNWPTSYLMAVLREGEKAPKPPAQQAGEADPQARMYAIAQPATVRANTRVPPMRESAFISSSTVSDDEMHLRAYEWAEQRGVDGVIMTSRMQVPSEILTADGVGYLFAVAPIPDDVMAELDHEDVERLAEALRKHGVELAHSIVQAKRRARAATQEGRGDEHAEP